MTRRDPLGIFFQNKNNTILKILLDLHLNLLMFLRLKNMHKNIQ